MDETEKYYAISLGLDKSVAFAIWVTGPSEPDRLVLSGSNQIALFQSQETLNDFADAHGFSIEADEIPIFDFDALMEWADTPTPKEIDCEDFLNAWNMLGDIARTLGKEVQEPVGADTVYEKLYYGNSLPAITPADEHYIPKWSEEDATIIVGVFTNGIQILRSGTSDAA